MKSNLITLAFMIFSFTMLQAQSLNDSKTSFSIIGGVNFQNLTGTDFDGKKLENNLITGFHVGAQAEIPIAPEFYFQPGLLFSTKGGERVDGPITTTTKLSYIELPLSFKYKGALGNGHVVLGLGPYIGYAIGGNVTDTENESNTQDIEFVNEVSASDPIATPYMKALDVGANFFTGYVLQNGLFLQLNAQLGLVEINPDDKRIPENDYSIKNTGFGISLGYWF